ncbi:hypothetical protein MKW94_009387 [Papaver nudicaule]|uniref:Uncharacterized protein n=1 Tax=Papaver nudicaule TaxID=74823 RepID=A0AA41RXF2_PAPNU|nr:hypothetical protein [Papaver nudicaule]
MVKPHVVCIPYMAQGHVTPMLRVAKLLHSKGFHVTFVNSQFNHQRLLNSRGADSLQDTCYEPFKELLTKLNDSEEVPPVSCIVGDGALSTFTFRVAKELGIPEVIFWTTSFCGFASYYHYPHLVEKGLFPLKGKHLQLTYSLPFGLTFFRDSKVQ